MALPRVARLRASTEIRTVLDAGRHRAGRYAALYWLDRNDASGPRAAFVVSRRVGGAVTRNRARRRLSEAVRRRLHRLRPTVDLVVVARGRAARGSFPEIEQDLCQQLRAAGLLLDEPDPGGEDAV